MRENWVDKKSINVNEPGIWVRLGRNSTYKSLHLRPNLSYIRKFTHDFIVYFKDDFGIIQKVVLDDECIIPPFQYLRIQSKDVLKKYARMSLFDEYLLYRFDQINGKNNFKIKPAKFSWSYC